MEDMKTRPFELRTKIESFKHETLNAISPFGRETAAVREPGESLTVLRLTKMISPLSPIAAV